MKSPAAANNMCGYREGNDPRISWTLNAAVLNNLAWVYYEQGDARALEYAEKAYWNARSRAMKISLKLTRPVNSPACNPRPARAFP